FFVGFVDHAGDPGSVALAVRRVEFAFGLGARDLLDQGDNIHVGGRPPCPCLRRPRGRSGTRARPWFLPKSAKHPNGIRRWVGINALPYRGVLCSCSPHQMLLASSIWRDRTPHTLMGRI